MTHKLFTTTLLLLSVLTLTLCSVTFNLQELETETVATHIEGSTITRWSRNPHPADAPESQTSKRAAPTCTTTSCPGIPVALSQTQITTILNAHNSLRASVTPAPATALPNLVWDANLANIWQNYPLQCKFQHTTNQWRSTVYANATRKAAYPNTYVGENLAYYAQYLRCTGTTINTCQKVLTYDINNLLNGWGAERACYQYSKVGSDICNTTCYQKLYSDGCGHYTQQIWQASTNIGCLVLNCTQYDISSANFGFQLFCAYYSGGNYVGQYPYAKKAKRDELETTQVESVVKEMAPRDVEVSQTVDNVVNQVDSKREIEPVVEKMALEIKREGEGVTQTIESVNAV